jgi:hydrogenase expression/formation protein HypE
MGASTDDDGLACPAPLSTSARVLLAHGGGGRHMQALLTSLIFPRLARDAADAHDAAIVEVDGVRLAFTTDGFVVKPLVFPGGDIGKLAVCGTLNDLAMAGARPRALSLALTLEEGLPLDVLERVIVSASQTARSAGVEIVTGDTKVVERGKADGLYVHTSGIGVVARDVSVHPRHIRAGDVVLVSGDVGRHGIAVLAARGELGLDVDVESCVAPVTASVHALLDAGVAVRCLRDPTRGGLASLLCELASASGLDIVLDEERVPLHPAVRGACALLGFDPLAVASEGRFVAVVASDDAERALAILRREHANAERIAEVLPGQGRVSARTAMGTLRAVDMPSGELLPRIC